jgi:hypothetical protein
VIRYTEMNAFGQTTDGIEIANHPQPDGTYLNDLTVGEYDIAITEVPLQATFENSQFQQALEMKKVGVAIPDEVVLRYSTLLDKEEIIEIMGKAKGNPADDAQAQKLLAEAELAKVTTVAKSVEAQFSAIRTAQVIATLPDTAGLADQLLRSAGYVDHDAAPIVPQFAGPPHPLALAPPENSHPLLPDNPDVGLDTGLTATPTPA